MTILSISCGQSAAIILLNSLLGKFYMTFGFRVPSTIAGKQQKLEDDKSFKKAHAAQLNEAEWSPLLITVLLYFHSQDTNLPIASSLVAYGSVWYLWSKIFLPFPSHIPGAVLRYTGLTLLCSKLLQQMFQRK